MYPIKKFSFIYNIKKKKKIKDVNLNIKSDKIGSILNIKKKKLKWLSFLSEFLKAIGSEHS